MWCLPINRQFRKSEKFPEKFSVTRVFEMAYYLVNTTSQLCINVQEAPGLARASLLSRPLSVRPGLRLHERVGCHAGECSDLRWSKRWRGGGGGAVRLVLSETRVCVWEPRPVSLKSDMPPQAAATAARYDEKRSRLLKPHQRTLCIYSTT